MVMSIHRLPVMGYSLAANMTNDSWLLIISPSSDPRSCICHLDRNCPIRPLLYSALLKASFYCQVKKWLISPPSTSVRRVKMDQWTVMAKVFFSHHCFCPLWQEEQSRYLLCGKLDHLLAGTIPHCDQCLHVKLLLTQDQEALLPWKQNNNR